MSVLLLPSNAVDAKTVNGKTTVSTERTLHNGTTVVNSNKKKKSFEERIHDILYPEPVQDTAPENASSVEKPIQTYSNETSILGGAVATKEQCVRYLLKNNPHPLLNTSPEQLVEFYYEEAAREGVRPDIAFAQALKETGYFSYGGTVIPAQNNYCGLGTTSATVKGAFFESPRVGVRAHIQHLLAYASTSSPTTPIVDPRYELVRKNYGNNILHEWMDLNGRWAVPGVGYGQSILDYYHAILQS
ncbi:MAG: glucosaminidase domain-containing protein [Anaerovibrio sp.]|nr:glucosaminidase domain-containing protein [Anaerovibrio sp.]